MPAEPWFKFYAADYLLDGDIDSLPLEARGVLLSMWCLCHIEGSCPGESEEIARKARLSSSVVAKHREQLGRFFETRDGRLYSRRMEAEKLKSETARTNANKRWRPGNANGNAVCIAQSQSQIYPPSEVLSTKSEPMAFRPRSSVEKQYSQETGDAIDWRKLCKARDQLTLKLSHGWGAGSNDRQIFEYQCALAGLTVARGLELQQRATKWPEETATEYSA